MFSGSFVQLSTKILEKRTFICIIFYIFKLFCANVKIKKYIKPFQEKIVYLVQYKLLFNLNIKIKNVKNN